MSTILEVAALMAQVLGTTHLAPCITIHTGWEISAIALPISRGHSRVGLYPTCDAGRGSRRWWNGWPDRLPTTTARRPAPNCVSGAWWYQRPLSEVRSVEREKT